MAEASTVVLACSSEPVGKLSDLWRCPAVGTSQSVAASPFEICPPEETAILPSTGEQSVKNFQRSKSDLPRLCAADDMVGNLNLLGRGAFGVVYQCVDKSGRRRAIKVAANKADKVANASVIKEYKMLSSCKHHNIIDCYGLARLGGRPAIAMELCQGGDLWKAIQADHKGYYRWYNRGRTIALDIAQGLAYLHTKPGAKVVHCDIKCDNVFLTNDGTAKIGDFGGAAILRKEEQYIRNATTLGTFAYAAPEMLLGEAYNESVDIYSFGILLWVLMTGEKPRRSLPRPLVCPDECPAGVASLIDDCMATNPSDRPTAEQMLHGIRENF